MFSNLLYVKRERERDKKRYFSKWCFSLDCDICLSTFSVFRQIVGFHRTPKRYFEFLVSMFFEHRILFVFCWIQLYFDDGIPVRRTAIRKVEGTRKLWNVNIGYMGSERHNEFCLSKRFVYLIVIFQCILIYHYTWLWKIL